MILCFFFFYELKGLILADARCLESFYSLIVFCVGLSQEGAYTSRCQMPGLFQNKASMDMIILVMVYILVTIQNCSGPWIDIMMWG